jgi:hypothetical protein
MPIDAVRSLLLSCRYEFVGIADAERLQLVLRMKRSGVRWIGFADWEYPDDTRKILLLLHKQRMYGRGWMIIAPNIDPGLYNASQSDAAASESNLQALEVMQGTLSSSQQCIAENRMPRSPLPPERRQEALCAAANRYDVCAAVGPVQASAFR